MGSGERSGSRSESAELASAPAELYVQADVPQSLQPCGTHYSILSLPTTFPLSGLGIGELLPLLLFAWLLVAEPVGDLLPFPVMDLTQASDVACSERHPHADEKGMGFAVPSMLLFLLNAQWWRQHILHLVLGAPLRPCKDTFVALTSSLSVPSFVASSSHRVSRSFLFKHSSVQTQCFINLLPLC